MGVVSIALAKLHSPLIRFLKGSQNLAKICLSYCTHIINNQFTSDRKNIYGEETNTFTNNLNQTVQLIINDDTENTR